MPVFYQQQMNDDTRLGIWKIEETEEFFRNNVPVHRDVTHPHKRLQHLAGRFLLQYLFPDFPYKLVQIADTRKPFLPDEQYHFSISHCGDYAAAIVSRSSRVGIDVEEPKEKILRIAGKFTSVEELKRLGLQKERIDQEIFTMIWSAKEAVFKWYGDGGVDFRNDIQLNGLNQDTKEIDCFFVKSNADLKIGYELMDGIVCSWVL